MIIRSTAKTTKMFFFTSKDSSSDVDDEVDEDKDQWTTGLGSFAQAAVPHDDGNSRGVHPKASAKTKVKAFGKVQVACKSAILIVIWTGIRSVSAPSDLLLVSAIAHKGHTETKGRQGQREKWW